MKFNYFVFIYSLCVLYTVLQICRGFITYFIIVYYTVCSISPLRVLSKPFWTLIIHV